MFYKADALRYDQNFFKPVSQLKTSVIVWYLMNPEPPCHVVSHLTASQVKSIWGITEEELEEMYFDDSGEISFANLHGVVKRAWPLEEKAPAPFSTVHCLDNNLIGLPQIQLLNFYFRFSSVKKKLKNVICLCLK